MTNILKEKQQLFENYIDYHEALFKTQVKIMQRLIATIPFQKLSRINIEQKLDKGEFIISIDNFLVEEKELDHIFDELFPVLLKYNNNDELHRLEDLYDKRKIHLKELVRHLLSRDFQTLNEISEKFNLSIRLLQRVVELISSPYLELCSEYFIKKIESKGWYKPHCPICGNHPTIGRSNEKGTYRILWCPICATEWKFKNNVCPFCENSDLKSIKYIFPPDNTANRIEACDKCGHYIKIIDADILPDDPNFTINNLSTYYLDVIALENRYSKYQLFSQNGESPATKSI